MKEIIRNKRISHNFKILDKWQAGLKLTGSEVKSVKLGQMDLTGSYITLKSDKNSNIPELYLINAKITSYPKAGYAQNNYNPLRNRKILLNRKEINSLIGKLKQKGLTLMPFSVYTTSHRLIKITIVLAKGKKKIDKRESIKKRDFDRRKNRILKN